MRGSNGGNVREGAEVRQRLANLGERHAIEERRQENE